MAAPGYDPRLDPGPDHDPSVQKANESAALALVDAMMTQNQARLDQANLALQQKRDQVTAGIKARAAMQRAQSAKQQAVADRVEAWANSGNEDTGEGPKPFNFPEIPTNVERPQPNPGFASGIAGQILQQTGPGQPQPGSAGNPVGGSVRFPVAVSNAPPPAGVQVPQPTGPPTGPGAPGAQVSTIPGDQYGIGERIVRGLVGAAFRQPEMLVNAALGGSPDRTTISYNNPTEDQLAAQLGNQRLQERRGLLPTGASDQMLESLQTQYGGAATSRISQLANGAAAQQEDADRAKMMAFVQPVIEDIYSKNPDARQRGLVDQFVQSAVNHDYNGMMKARADMGILPTDRLNAQSAAVELDTRRAMLRVADAQAYLYEQTVLDEKLAREPGKEGTGFSLWEMAGNVGPNPYLSPTNAGSAVGMTLRGMRSSGRRFDPADVVRETARHLDGQISGIGKTDAKGNTYLQLNKGAEFTDAAQQRLFMPGDPRLVTVNDDGQTQSHPMVGPGSILEDVRVAYGVAPPGAYVDAAGTPSPELAARARAEAIQRLSDVGLEVLDNGKDEQGRPRVVLMSNPEKFGRDISHLNSQQLDAAARIANNFATNFGRELDAGKLQLFRQGVEEQGSPESMYRWMKNTEGALGETLYQASTAVSQFGSQAARGALGVAEAVTGQPEGAYGSTEPMPTYAPTLSGYLAERPARRADAELNAAIDFGRRMSINAGAQLPDDTLKKLWQSTHSQEEFTKRVLETADAQRTHAGLTAPAPSNPATDLSKRRQAQLWRDSKNWSDYINRVRTETERKNQQARAELIARLKKTPGRFETRPTISPAGDTTEAPMGPPTPAQVLVDSTVTPQVARLRSYQPGAPETYSPITGERAVPGPEYLTPRAVFRGGR